MKKTMPLRSASRTSQSSQQPANMVSTRSDKPLDRLFLVKRPHPLTILAMRLRWDINVNPLEFE
jgi:hypothetical protein